MENLKGTFHQYTDPSGALKAILMLRLVSKSWKAAAAQYTGKLSIKVRRPTDLGDLSRLLPRVSKLHIVGASGSVLDFLAAFLRPSGLPQAQDRRAENPPLDVSALPLSLVDLSLSDCQVSPASFEQLSTANLTSLSLDNVKASPVQKHQLLQYLTKLQELSITQLTPPDLFPHPVHDLSAYLGYPSLTSLKLDGGNLLFTPRQPIRATSLKKLALGHVMTDAAELSRLCNSMPSMTHLTLEAAVDTGDRMRTIPSPATNLRFLGLYANHPIFIQLAGPDLLSLTIMPDEGEGNQEMPIRTVTAIANLSALTKLDLSGYYCTTRLSTLQYLKLQELSLHSSPGAAEAMLLSGAMTTLQRLHIREMRVAQAADVEAYNNDLADAESEGHQKAQQLRQLGKVLFSLPSLVQVSGSCRLFTCAMAEGLKDWSVWKEAAFFGQECTWKKLD